MVSWTRKPATPFNYQGQLARLDGADRGVSDIFRCFMKLGMRATVCIILCAFTVTLILHGAEESKAEASPLGGGIFTSPLGGGIFGSTPRILVSNSTPFITVEDSYFGDKIEGTSVDSRGRIYAVDFEGQTQQLGQLSNERGEVDQRLLLKWNDIKSYFNGIRFIPVPEDDKNSKVVSGTAVVADKKGQILQILESKEGVVSGRVFCKDEKMIEPNDVAVAYKSERVYSTGLRYAGTTQHGDGQIWLCEITSGSSIFSPNLGSGPIAEATMLRVQGRANGIEVSYDEKHLYLSETWAKEMKIYSNVVWKFDIDQDTGHLSNKRLFFDMKDIDEDLQGKAGDIDGVRTDSAGNLFLVRNGDPGEVVKVSPAGLVVERIKLPGITEPTNIEFGGSDGKTLYIVGKCKETRPGGVQVGCINVWHGNRASGRAFSNLVRSRTELKDEL